MTYEMRTETLDGIENGSYLAAYSLDGGYIGDEDFAKFLAAKGIAPTVIDGRSVCSIGFCEAEQKWYGWSHRAMFGFGIGSEVKRGDCGYQPTNADDFLDDVRRFWSDDDKLNMSAEHAERDGDRGVMLTWTYSDTIPNTAMRGEQGEHFSPYPETYGRGEWTAVTLEDAKQMAIDFAESVS